MFHGAFALLERSLRIDARNVTTHLCRLGLIVSIYASLCFALTTQNRFGAPGLRFFQGIAYLDLAFITLLGFGYFSTSITEEKEEDTLGLMQMAGISPLGILAGKSIGRLWQAILLVAAQYPFMLLAVTMGGVTSLQVQAVTLALVAYTIFLAGLGLLCSTLAPRSRSAGTMMIVGLVIYFVIPVIAQTLLALVSRKILQGINTPTATESWRRVLEGLEDACVFLRMGEILSTAFFQSVCSVQVVSNIVLGIAFAVVAWLLFGFAVRNPSTEATSRGLVARRRSFLRFNAGRPRINPFVWKDFHFVSGGIGTIFVRFVLYVGLCIAVLGIQDFLQSSGGAAIQIEPLLMLLSLVVALDAAMLLAQTMHEEIRGQTLSSLLMLPHSPIGIVYSKFLGSLLGWFPGPLVLLAVTLNTDDGRRNFFSLLKNEGGGWCVGLLFILIPHFAALAALYVRWGSVPVAIGLTIGVYFMIVAGLGIFNGPQDEFFGVAAFLMSVTCVACHLGVLLRVQALAAR